MIKIHTATNQTTVSANIILTGFRPFNIYKVNSSWEAAKELSIQRKNIITEEIEVDFQAAHQQVTGILQVHHPNIMLLTGLADIQHIRIEKVARKPTALKKVGGPPLLRGNWPWIETILEFEKENIPCDFSEDAGSYVCESSYWSALNFRYENGYPEYVCFIHVPVLSKLWNAKKLAAILSLSIDVAQRSLEAYP